MRLFALAGAIALSSALAFAHDPGLSQLVITQSPDGWSARLIFSLADIDGIDSLDEVVAQDVRFTSDGVLLPLRVQSRRALDEVELALELPPATGEIVLDASMLGRLPRGHFQFVRVVSPDGVVLLETLLDSERTVLSMPREAVESVSTSKAFLGGGELMMILAGLVLIVGVRSLPTIQKW